VSELDFLEHYTGQSLDELIALEGKYRIDSLVLAIEEGLQPKTQLTDAEETVLAVEALEREVGNGGFHQFFFNTPEHAPYVVESLRLIGCPKTATLAEKAIKALRIDGPLTEKIVRAVAEEDNDLRDELLDKYDDVYYDGAEEPICDKVFAFVKAHEPSITLVGPSRRRR